MSARATRKASPHTRAEAMMLLNSLTITINVLCRWFPHNVDLNTAALFLSRARNSPEFEEPS